MDKETVEMALLGYEVTQYKIAIKIGELKDVIASKSASAVSTGKKRGRPRKVAVTRKPSQPKKRVVSAETRAKMAASQRARRAK